MAYQEFCELWFPRLYALNPFLFDPRDVEPADEDPSFRRFNNITERRAKLEVRRAFYEMRRCDFPRLSGARIDQSHICIYTTRGFETPRLCLHRELHPQTEHGYTWLESESLP